MFLAIIRKMEGKGPGATKSAILPKALLNIFSFQNTYKKVKYNFKKVKAGNMAYPLELPSQFFSSQKYVSQKKNMVLYTVLSCMDIRILEEL